MSHKRMLLTTVVFFFGLFLITAHAQATYGDTIFFDDFGQHIIRVTTPYMPNGSYTFASGSSTNSNEKEIQDNYYAVVDPRHIADVAPASYFWTSTSPIYTTPVGAKYYTEDHTKNLNGAVMVVNAGVTVNYIYKRPVKLKTGFRYRFSFWIYVVARSSQFSMEVVNQNNNTNTTFSGPLISSEGEWINYSLDFPVPLSSTATTNDVTAGLQNKYSLITGNDYYIDDILLSTLHTDPVIITASNISPVCEGQSIVLNSIVTGGASPFVYSWTGPNGFTSHDQNPILVNATSAANGTYHVAVTDALGQTDTASTDAIVNPAPNSNFTLSTETINSRHNSVTFSIIPEKNVIYNWDFGDGTTGTQPSISHTYTISGTTPEFSVQLNAIDSIGCNSTSTKTIDVVPFIPNVFSPNGDAVNDVFMDGFELQVFDRNGMLIYKGTSGWNGTYKGKEMDNDTYYYYLNYTDKNKNIQTSKGFVTLKR